VLSIIISANMSKQYVIQVLREKRLPHFKQNLGKGGMTRWTMEQCDEKLGQDGIDFFG